MSTLITLLLMLDSTYVKMFELMSMLGNNHLSRLLMKSLNSFIIIIIFLMNDL